jgi:hypothetical protein
MNTKGKIAIEESKTTSNTPTFMRWAGVSAMLAGLCFVITGMFHPVNVPSAVTTATWANVHIFVFAMGYLGSFGMAGLYLRQAKKSGWLSLVGFVLFSGWMILVSGFSFVEAFILPRLVTESPKFVEGFLGMFTGIPSEIDLGILPTVSKIADIMYLLGPLLFGIATFRAGILPRWAGALMIAGATLGPIGATLVPAEYQPLVLLPHGLALVWLGNALFSERRERSAESRLEQRNTQTETGQVA